ncbi:MAG: gamma-glutamyl-gamma-aminobutyrate hydrolase family protein [Pseudohongiellaceae bacterium]
MFPPATTARPVRPITKACAAKSRKKSTSKRRTPLPLKSLIIEHDSRYLSYMGTSVRRINSLHNQAIDRLGKGLSVAGRDLDGIVQAVEDRSARFRLGVQWHPEFLLYLPVQRQLFRQLANCISE